MDGCGAGDEVDFAAEEVDLCGDGHRVRAARGGRGREEQDLVAVPVGEDGAGRVEAVRGRPLQLAGFDAPELLNRTRVGYDGIALALGMDPNAAMAELFGKDTGCSRGMGGSMHFFDVKNGFYGGWGIVGGHIALAAGAAFKAKYNGEDRVTVCFFGEGATNIGGFHEALSLAGLWKLPIVFICENNQYAMGTPMERTSPLSDLTLKAQGYGMSGDRFEGYDVANVRDRVGQAVARARRGEGPTFIEIETYRFRGHSMSDPAKYRSRAELEERKKKDPCAVVRSRLLEAGVKENDLLDLEGEVDDQIEAAVKFAGESPLATEASMHRVYVDTNSEAADA